MASSESATMEAPISPTSPTSTTFPTSVSPTTSGDESSAPTDKMPRHNPLGKAFLTKRPEIDLSAMLNHEQLKQLNVIMTAIMDDMQTQLRDNFDKLIVPRVEPTEGIVVPKAITLSVPNPRSDKYRGQYGDIGLPLEKLDFDDRDALKRIMKQQPANPDPLTPKPTLTIPRSAEEATENAKKTELELVTSSLSEMKRDALGHFGKWRGNVFKRLHEIVIKHGGTGGNIARQPPQQARGLGAVRRGSIARTATPVKPVMACQSSRDASNTLHMEQFPALYTALCQAPKEKRALILHTMLLMFLGLGQYPTYSRTALLKLATALHIPTFVLLDDEFRISQGLAQIIEGISPDEIAQRRAEEAKPHKRWRSGGVQTPVPVVFSDILADPLIIAGAGTVFGGVGLSAKVTATLLGGVGSAESTVPVGTLFGLYGARQGGKAMEAYSKDVQDFALMQIHGYPQTELIDPKDVPVEYRRMRATFAISGWTTAKNDFQYPWKILGQQTEAYAMRWELDSLRKIGDAIRTVTTSRVWSGIKEEMASRTVFGCLTQSHWPTDLVKASKILDNPWTVAMVRAEKAGNVLAEILNNKVQGERSVSLIGYGIGARVVYSCLMALSEKRSFGIVENAVLFGAPCPSEIHAWAAMRSVVAGRLVNVYSKTDYLLSFMYRSCSWQYGVAGLQPIQGIHRLQNIDLSDILENHLHYQFHIGDILKKLGWEDINYVEVTENQAQLELALYEENGDGIPKLQQRNGNVIQDQKTPQQMKPMPKTNGLAKTNGAAKTNGVGKSNGFAKTNGFPKTNGKAGYPTTTGGQQHPAQGRRAKENARRR
ncbi:DUF726-domain-containing protein [Xylariaceae sp. FL0255]|nr:DUF726-domain-containing protein [Xylariaceae sp. FL0255]